MTLRANLRACLARARGDEDREFVFSWDADAGPIKVGVKQTREGYVVVSLERLNLAPSDGEWQQVLAVFPERAPGGVVPTPRKDGRRHALVGRWARPADPLVAPQE